MSAVGMKEPRKTIAVTMHFDNSKAAREVMAAYKAERTTVAFGCRFEVDQLKLVEQNGATYLDLVLMEKGGEE